MRHKAIAVIAAAVILGIPGIGFAGEEASQKDEAKTQQEAGTKTGAQKFAAVYIPPPKAAPRQTVAGATRGGH